MYNLLYCLVHYMVYDTVYDIYLCAHFVAEVWTVYFMNC